MKNLQVKTKTTKMTNDDLEPIEGPKEKVIEAPKITEILDDPMKLVDWQYQTFISDKTKEIKQILNDTDEAKREWDILANDRAYQGLPTFEAAGRLIKEYKRCFWIYKLMFEKASKTIDDMKEIKEKYYLLKKDALEGKEEQKEVIQEIDKEEEEKGKAFVKFCEDRITGYEIDAPKQVVQQQLVGNLTKNGKQWLAMRLQKFIKDIGVANLPEKIKEEVYLIYFDLHNAYFEIYGKYPFTWLRMAEINKIKQGIKG